MYEFVLMVEREIGVNRKVTRAVMRKWREFAAQSLSAGRPVSLDKFGGFKLTRRKGRGKVTVNLPRRGGKFTGPTEVFLPDSVYVTFKASKQLRNQIKNYDTKHPKTD